MGSAPKNVMGEIIAICRKRRLYYKTVTHKGKHQHLIFRKRPEGDPRPGGIFVDKCDGGELALLHAIQRVAGITPGQPKPAEPESAL